MPSLNFVLPHWLYWGGLIVFPLIAMFIARRQDARRSGGISLSFAYLMLVCGGFVGLHRFYLKSWLGVLYVPLFIIILFGNVEERTAREGLSAARNDQLSAEFLVERAEGFVKAGRDGAPAMLEKARADLADAVTRHEAADAELGFWRNVSLGAALVMLAGLILDAVLLPRLYRRCREREPLPEGPSATEQAIQAAEEALAAGDPTQNVRSGFTNIIDRLNGFVGEFVSYWSLIAVFVYYYEVVARYVFNSPTNWAHEGMFLMFGMQYLLSGGYALREDSHVRVDVIYGMMSARAKVITDIVTSTSFFIFTGTLLVTGWIFAHDSIRVAEVSFSEWGIQYWPVKSMIALGAALILLQGIARLIKDLLLLRGRRA
ncbi:TRAP transporter small permease subunit [Oceanibacterium hippocampi]|uniref:TRAP transporter small permease protein n=1 Tax=Oceanibacterium hippocampi TaxID=745714 RepID=A0A1Y5T3M5_9PROT|nr:TRAP transporter small permease subunit [Oceanibacterium hippocampi]SLN54964.1 Tripartite ATP-independent periplasmic transporters, DctQ component [Oceanibacterium hippocampi]